MCFPISDIRLVNTQDFLRAECTVSGCNGLKFTPNWLLCSPYLFLCRKLGAHTHSCLWFQASWSPQTESSPPSEHVDIQLVWDRCMLITLHGSCPRPRATKGPLSSPERAHARISACAQRSCALSRPYRLAASLARPPRTDALVYGHSIQFNIDCIPLSLLRGLCRGWLNCRHPITSHPPRLLLHDR